MIESGEESPNESELEYRSNHSIEDSENEEEEEGGHEVTSDSDLD